MNDLTQQKWVTSILIIQETIETCVLASTYPCCSTKMKDSIWKLGICLAFPQIPTSNTLISCNNRNNTNSFMSISNQERPFLKSNENSRGSVLPFLPSSVPLHPRSHLPTLPSLWSVLGSAMMAWTATMASLILVWSSLSSSMCSRRRIWAASFRVASEEKCILLSRRLLRFMFLTPLPRLHVWAAANALL